MPPDHYAQGKRRSIRLRGYDYARTGAYFVTICTQNRALLFGDTVDGEMILNDPGLMVMTVWNQLPNRFPHLELDACVVMPNHIHGIFVLHRRGEPCVRPEPCVQSEMDRPETDRPETDDPEHKGEHKVRPYNDPIFVVNHSQTGEHKDRPYGTLLDTVGRVVQAFKSITTHEYARGVKQCGWPRFKGKLWQRNYYEHVIRNDGELNRIRKYIAENPAQWALDRENPVIKNAPGRINR
ncbi:MAG: hypothetical protein K9K79_10055 [Desulfohalobiaceae bacterium]|nr:hypothetical protein [Desulfohalobiaceae bacterium]